MLQLSAAPVHQTKKYNGIKCINVATAEEMYNACINMHDEMDIEIMAAAVADYKPANVSAEKIKKDKQDFTLALEKTKDILATLGQKKQKQFLVGFALETNNERRTCKK